MGMTISVVESPALWHWVNEQQNATYHLRVLWKDRAHSVELEGNWFHVSRALAREFANTSLNLFRSSVSAKFKNARSHHPDVANKKPNLRPHYKKANYCLRWLREQGVELSPIYHPLQRRAGYPSGPPTPEFVALWDKDHVFRGLCLHLRDASSWDNYTDYVTEQEHGMLSRLPRPFKHLLAQRRISITVASKLSNLCSEEQKALLVAPKWALGSRATLSTYLCVISAEKLIRQCGRSPSKDFTRLTRSRMPAKTEEWGTALHSFSEAGGVVPTSFKGIANLVRDLHDRTSMAYGLVNRHDRNTDVWVPNMPLPVLPDIKASIQILQDAQDYSNEGNSMNHCIGMYAGTKGLFAHVERGEERASLYLSCEGTGYQCLGPCNQMNPLTRDVTDHWLPVLKEWVSPDKFVNKTAKPKPEPALPEYD
jgi:hypothetical protein